MTTQKQIFVNLVEQLCANSGDIELLIELEENPFFIYLQKSVRRKPAEIKKNEAQKLKDSEYVKCENCDKLIKQSYIDTHIEKSITCYRQRQTKRNVFLNKELYNDKYAVTQALNISLKDKHLEFKDLVLPEKTLRILRCRTKYDIFRT
jgi:hypothetical protein